MRRLVSNNQLLKGVVYKTKNIIVQKIQNGTKRNEKCYLIGNGHSLSIDENDCVIKHDPLMHEFKPKIKEEHTVYAFYFTFECLGLESASQDVANFVNSIGSNYEEIILVGHSKCGLCLTNATYYCIKDCTLVTISSPFKGTIIASKDETERILKSPLLIKLYNKIFSNHLVDIDIIPGSRFIKKMHCPQCKNHINIVSSLEKISDCRNVVDLFLMFLDKNMEIKGDGIVPLSSQEYICCTKSIKIFCSHSSSLKKGIEIIDNL